MAPTQPPAGTQDAGRVPEHGEGQLVVPLALGNAVLATVGEVVRAGRTPTSTCGKDSLRQQFGCAISSCHQPLERRRAGTARCARPWRSELDHATTPGEALVLGGDGGLLGCRLCQRRSSEVRISETAPSHGPLRSATLQTCRTQARTRSAVQTTTSGPATVTAGRNRSADDLPPREPRSWCARCSSRRTVEQAGSRVDPGR